MTELSDEMDEAALNDAMRQAGVSGIVAGDALAQMAPVLQQLLAAQVEFGASLFAINETLRTLSKAGQLPPKAWGKLRYQRRYLRRGIAIARGKRRGRS